MSDNVKNGGSVSGTDYSVIEKLRERARERQTMQEEIHKAGKPIFDKLKDEYHQKLMLAIQDHSSKYSVELTAKFGSRDEWGKQEAIIDEDSQHHCRICGVHEQYRKAQNERSEWLGIGETEDCKCGAGYELHHPRCKKPLTEQSISTLLETAQNVESAYLDANLPMTYEQISMNRSYFRRIINAIDAAKHNHFHDRFLKFLEYKRYTDRYYEMLDIMARVDGGEVARGYMKYGDPPCDLAEIDEMVAELELELAAKRILSS